jgi:hypothetical protein
LTWRVQQFAGYDALPPSYEPLMEEAARLGLFFQRVWYEYLMAQFYSEGNLMQLYAVEDVRSGAPVMLLPVRYTRSDAAVNRSHAIASISHLENYASGSPIFAADLGVQRREVLTTLFEWMRKSRPDIQPRRAEVIRLWPFEVGSDLGLDVRQSLREAGFIVQGYTNSVNQYENTSGLDYEAYFAARSSNQRYNSRRRRRNLEKNGALEFVMYTGDEDPALLRRATDEYILVSVRSWKSPGSTVSSDVIDLIALAASQRCLRLGILYLNEVAIAAQFWIFTGGVASALRVHYDEAYKQYAPGVVLSSFCIEHLLDRDHAGSLDFGYGGDEYKEKWMKSSRFYCGFMAFNPASARGLYYASVHIAGQFVKRVLKAGMKIVFGSRA